MQHIFLLVTQEVMQGDANRVRYWLVLPQQQRDELNPYICPFAWMNKIFHMPLHTAVKGVDVRWPRWQIEGTPLPLKWTVEYSLH